MTPAILSQSEIDALLAAIPVDPRPAATGERKVRSHSFRDPSPLTRDRIQTLEMVHACFARSLGADLSARLRSTVSVVLLSVTRETYDEFARATPIPAVLYVLGMEPLPGLAVLEIHPSVAFVVIDRLLGGVGRGIACLRELTEVEHALLRPVVDQALAALGAAWAQTAEVKPVLQHSVSTAQALRIAGGADAVIVATFEIRLFETTGRIRLCLPGRMLEPIWHRLRAGYRPAPESEIEGGNGIRPVQRSLGNVTVPVVALLGSARVTLGDLMDIEQGDFIRLDTSPSDDLEVLIAGEPRFRGRPGLSGRRLAVMITSVIEQEDEPIDAD